MRNAITLWILSSVLLLVAAARTPAPAISITISAADSAPAAKSAVKVTITVKNVTRRRIVVDKLLGGETGEFLHEFDVRNARGEPAAETEYYRGFKEGGPDGIYEIMGHPLEPGESLVDNVTLSKLYDLSLPGRYTIQARRRDSESKTYVKSNTITLTVK
jgi:hypothetical protein